MAFPLTPAEHYDIEARIQALPELIVAAAVRTPMGNITRERPARHGDLWALLPRGMTSDDPDVTHGFMTSRGRFVDRQEAARLVVETGQGASRVFAGYAPALFSEDMWLDLFDLPARPAENSADDGGDGVPVHSSLPPAELSRLQHSLSLAVEALGPFARAYSAALNGLPPDMRPIRLELSTHVTPDDFRRAREVHSKLTGGG